MWLTQLMGLKGLVPNDIDACIIASVVPEAVFNLIQLARRYFNTKPLNVGDRGVDLGIGIKLPHPEEVGADRLVNAVAARERLAMQSALGVPVRVVPGEVGNVKITTPESPAVTQKDTRVG